MKATIGSDLLRTLSKTPLPAKSYDIRDTKLRGFTLRVRPSGLHSYLLSVGRGRWLTLGRIDEIKPAKARDLAEKANGVRADGRDPIRERQSERARLIAEREAKKQAAATEARTLGAYLDTVYGPWLLAHQKTGAETLARIEATFPTLLDLPLHALTPWHIEAWKTTRRKAKRRPATLNRDLNALKALLARAVKWGHLSRHPLDQLRPDRTDRRGVVRYLTTDEETRLRDALTARDDSRRAAREQANAWRRDRGYPEWPALGTYTDHLTPLVLLALNTGLRRGELFGLRWGAIDWIQHLVAVRGETAKTGTSRHVDLNADALDVLTTWRDQSEDTSASALVFPSAAGTPLDNVQTAWEALLTDAKIERFRFHDLRHTFASKLVQAGVPLQVVAQLLGHASVLMTERYAHLAPSQTREAVALLVAQR